MAHRERLVENTIEHNGTLRDECNNVTTYRHHRELGLRACLLLHQGLQAVRVGLQGSQAASRLNGGTQLGRHILQGHRQ